MALFICILFIVITIIFLSGHGSMLIAGYNTSSDEAKKKINKKQLTRRTGILMIFMLLGSR